MAHEPLSAGSPRSTGSRIPSVPFGFLPREHASARFAEALSRYPVVLLVAPNGYGKTAFLAHELASFPDPVAWLTIDDRVLTPTTFFRALKRSLEQAVPTLETATGGRSESSPETGRPVSTRTCGSSSDAETAPRICIVMDGYERIESDDIDSGIDALMAYLPAGAHLVIVSSTRPHLSINRMELSGRLLEMKTADLSFDAEEAAALYNDTLDLSLPLEAVERINDRMDGWVAGLRMAEVALQSGTSVESVLAAGSESQRGISAYLIDDIVDRQSDDVRTFLFESSMFDAFCAELCDYAFERTDSRTMIEQILGNDLFLQPAGQRGWYRYANFFRRCLQDLAADALDGHRQAAHKRASAWFSAHDRYEEALEQALDADDYDQVVALMNNDYAAMMGQDASVRMRDLIHDCPRTSSSEAYGSTSAAVACEMQQCFTQKTHTSARLLHTPRTAGTERRRRRTRFHARRVPPDHADAGGLPQRQCRTAIEIGRTGSIRHARPARALRHTERHGNGMVVRRTIRLCPLVLAG